MTEGTSQGLFVVVAIVIFGIFVGLSYTIFGDVLQPQLVSLFEAPLTKVKDQFNGVVNRQLVDIRTIYKASGTIPTDIYYGLEKNIEKGTVKVGSPKEGTFLGISIPTRALTKEKTKYILTFNMTLDEGNVTHLGGHLGGNEGGEGVSDVVIRIDGQQVTPDFPEASKNSWYSGVPIPNGYSVGDTIFVEVEYFRDYFAPSDYLDNTIKVQPNRNWGAPKYGYDKDFDYKVTFSKISMLEMEN